jgi:hypothetical protein
MAEVVYLKKHERAPRVPGALLIQVVSDRSQESAESGPNGVKLRIRKSGYEATLADMMKEAYGTPMKVIYVKGAAD